MRENLVPPKINRDTNRGAVRLTLYAFLLVATLLILATPASGQWDVPQTAEPDRHMHLAARELTIPTPIPTPAELPQQAQVPILMYHYVSELPPDADSIRRDLTVLPENFAAQLDYLAAAGYHTITLSDMYHHFAQGYPLPEKPIVLTFDDGYRDAYTVVFPMLLERGMTGTFFVLATPTHYESPDYITWDHMREMSRAGMDIQAHGRDHVDLRNRSNDFLVYQILGIQEAILINVGHLPRFFCYPSGQYDQDVIAVLKSAGYWGAVTTAHGADHTLAGLFEMPRLRIHGYDTLESFAARLGD